MTALPEVKRRVTGAWMAGAFAVAFALAIAVIARAGAGHDGTITALRVTARWSYAWFWPAYAGGALAAVLGSAFRPLAQRARDLGLAFAAAQSVHAGLVAWLYHVAAHPPGMGTLAFFGTALFFTYALALTSFPQLAERLPPASLRALRTVGVEFIALAFIVDFAVNPFGGSLSRLLAYLPFQLLAFAGVVLRIVAWQRRFIESRRLVG